ncbi:FAD-binding protein [Desulfobotulus sp. H1]|uniref:FAD-binding protein n=1 Tax=Desulfobotulus pelophilus TaxID=2823377 RepID=A0ABT3NBJ4_9BACT|nr:FAD-binding protein [Desulfobotulus pelophilus]MCW7754834.1 FAD-binding protein [Desulfobotulus pelophilus]
MQRFDIRVSPEEMEDKEKLHHMILARAAPGDPKRFDWRIRKQSLDARGRKPLFVLLIECWEDEAPPLEKIRGFEPKALSGRRVVIAGAGPAGYFAALRLLERGIQPLVLERGKDVRSRLFDIKTLYKGEVHPHSNYCFGEGGAGTYSDGKLYTRATKRGDIRRVLDLFRTFGASASIRTEAHPHIGSNRLPAIVKAMREAIVSAGGEVHFNAFMKDFMAKDGRFRAAVLEDGERVEGDALILATGHSARDVYALLHEKGVLVEAKPFAMGVRIEHPQERIDRIFYGASPRHPALPPASYRISCQASGRGVFSFCMCPGGSVVPASTAPGELVLNGMSFAERSGPFANAGLVTELRLTDLDDPDGNPFAGLHFQQAVEQFLFRKGDGSQKAPAQRASDFVAARLSADLPRTSYIPGIYSAPLHQWLPPVVTKGLSEGLRLLDRRHRGYLTEEATLLAVESRTSSPVRIPRDPQTRMHPEVYGLFPCGEGAGYAGGIASAAMDGMASAEAVERYVAML